MYSKENPGVDPLDYGQQVNEGMSKFFGEGKIVFHWTLRHPNFEDQTFGGLHKTKKAVEAVRSREAQGTESKLKSRKWENTPIIQLGKGQKYKPWGVGGQEFIHGLTDGTHGSKIKTGSLALDHIAGVMLKIK